MRPNLYLEREQRLKAEKELDQLKERIAQDWRNQKSMDESANYSRDDDMEC